MREYYLTAEADEDWDDIWEYIAQDNVNAADKWDASYVFEMLAGMLRAGHVRRDLSDRSVLFWPVGAYLIVYRISGERVEILAITHGSRDIPSFLGQRME